MHRMWTASALLCMVLMPAMASAQAQFEEQNGFVIMEMESVPIPQGADWEEKSELAGAVGDKYYQFVGNGICNGPANSPLRYSFEIKTQGLWELRLRAARYWHCVDGQPHNNNRCEENDRTCNSYGQPTNNECGAADQCIRTDISNDAFVHIEDANGDYVSWIDQPMRTVGDPIKLFGGGADDWGWTGKRALDVTGRKWDAHWALRPGEYTLVVQGRSKDFRIDRLALFDTNNHNIREADQLSETLATPDDPPEDMGMSEDMSMSQDMASGPDMSSQDDMGAGDPDMGAGDPDMGSPDQGQDPGGEDMATSTPESDMGQDSGQPKAETSDEESSCASSPRQKPTNPLAILLTFMVGLLFWRRR